MKTLATGSCTKVCIRQEKNGPVATVSYATERNGQRGQRSVFKNEVITNRPLKTIWQSLAAKAKQRENIT